MNAFLNLSFPQKDFEHVNAERSSLGFGERWRFFSLEEGGVISKHRSQRSPESEAAAAVIDTC